MPRPTSSCSGRRSNEHGVGDLSRRYLSLVARHLRDAGTHRSTAEVIDAVRLAETLSALKDGLAPTLADLRDAAVTLLGHGEPVTVREALAHVDVGTAIGQLPKGVSQTSIQADFDRELARLKLEKYRTAVQQELDLDLRENRRVKGEEAAFLDLHRSSFFHRLRVLGVSFARPAPTRQQSATWAEKWSLQWTPESEIRTGRGRAARRDGGAGHRVSSSSRSSTPARRSPRPRPWSATPASAA